MGRPKGSKNKATLKKGKLEKLSQLSKSEPPAKGYSFSPASIILMTHLGYVFRGEIERVALEVAQDKKYIRRNDIELAVSKLKLDGFKNKIQDYIDYDLSELDEVNQQDIMGDNQCNIWEAKIK